MSGVSERLDPISTPAVPTSSEDLKDLSEPSDESTNDSLMPERPLLPHTPTHVHTDTFHFAGSIPEEQHAR